MAETKTQNQEKLIGLIKQSATLNAQNKKSLLEQIDSLAEVQVLELIAVFEKEKNQLKQVKEKYDQEELQLKTDYLKTVNEFQKKNMRKALKQEEELEQEDQKPGLENMVDQLKTAGNPNPDLKKTDKKNKNFAIKIFITVVAVILVAGVIYYLYTAK